jgi:two-component system cell cycle sensor histidine kinase/response regulator CckA
MVAADAGLTFDEAVMSGELDAVVHLQAELAEARAALRDLQQRHDRLTDNSHDVISRIDAEGRVTYVSPSIRKVLGYEPEDLVGKVGFEFIDPSQQEARRAGLAEGLKQGKAPIVSARVRRKDGSWVWMEYRTDPLFDDEGKVVEFQSISHDVTARHEAEEALRRSEQNFETFVRSMPVPAIIHRDARFLLVNDAYASTFGYREAELLGRCVFDFVAGDDRAYVEERVQMPIGERAGVPTREHRLLHADGPPVVVDVTAVPVFFRGELCSMSVARDLRERKRLEAQLITADRMASLGRLSAAVGHEINNPLAYMLGSLTLVERELAEVGLDGERAGQIAELLGNIREGAQRIRDIVQDLRALSRERTDGVGPVDLRRVLDVAAAMADHELRRRARLVKAYGDLPPVRGTEAKLGQVFLNLLVNAAQAIPEGDGDSHEVRIEARAAADGAVVVDVTDTGVGIEAELVDRVFEPFFTTKAGEGTGLGLSISQHIVTSLGGTMTVAPAGQRGTCFRVVLPGAETAGAADERAPTPARAVPDAAARVLVVDDEPQLAETIARLLRPRSVDVAHGGREALERIRAGERYDVILCDLQMRDGSGMDLYERLRRELPGIERRVVLMTGGGVTGRTSDLAARSGCTVLDKPFDAQTLESTIARVLAGG